MNVSSDAHSDGAGLPADVVIVGGGFSGVAVAIHLMRASRAPRRIAIVEPRASIGLGIAYETMLDGHRMNVPAGRLGCIAGEPSDFLAWCAARGWTMGADDFTPRKLFGAYVRDRLESTAASPANRVSLSHVRLRAETIKKHADRITLIASNDRCIEARHVVLALGNGPPNYPAAFRTVQSHPRVLGSPWNYDRVLELARTSRRILLVGTGLTMCDAVVSLTEAGYDGELVAVSRHGLMPKTHELTMPHEKVAAVRLAATTLRGIVRELRARAAQRNWRLVVDELRPHTQAIWQSLSPADRRRFVSRLATMWDVHRHRLPPATSNVICRSLSANRLTLIAGRIASVVDANRDLNCEIQMARGRCAHYRFDGVILCAGANPDPSTWGSPLLDELLADGDLATDDLRMGLRADDESLAIGADGNARPWCSILGPLRRGELWETTAIREIVEQAARIAERQCADDGALVPTIETRS